MPEVKVRTVQSRLGSFCLVKVGETFFLTPCDTRVKIIQSLGTREMTAEELTKVTGAAYSTVMDHMDLLERLGLVSSFLKREGGRRRINFRLNERPSEQIATVVSEEEIMK